MSDGPDAPYDDTRRLYRAVATEFDRSRDRSLFERRWLDKVLVRVRPDPQILYPGCGAGEPVARYLIEAGARITGVDFAPEMLATARQRFPDHDWIRADIRQFSPSRTFDAVVMWSVLFHLTPDDQRAMFPLFATWLAPGAPLLFQTGIAAGTATGSVAGRPVYHASLDTAEYRGLLSANGFTVVEYTPEDAETGGFTLWLATRNKSVSQPG